MNSKDKIEVCRSFSAKLNSGNYENKDFFCSAKADANFEDAESVSQELYHFCKRMVEKDIEAFIESNKPEHEKVIEIDAPYTPKQVVQAQKRMFGQEHEIKFDDEPEKEAEMQFRHGQNKAEGKYISNRR